MSDHDLLCPNYQGSCCPWMGDCSCQCDCEFITQIREDERNKDLDYHYVAAQAEAEGQRIMLAKCFAVVEKFDDVDEIELIIADLRALQQKP